VTKREITPENMNEDTLIATVTFGLEKVVKNEVITLDLILILPENSPFIWTTFRGKIS